MFLHLVLPTIRTDKKVSAIILQRRFSKRLSEFSLISKCCRAMKKKYQENPKTAQAIIKSILPKLEEVACSF